MDFVIAVFTSALLAAAWVSILYLGTRAVNGPPPRHEDHCPHHVRTITGPFDWSRHEDL